MPYVNYIEDLTQTDSKCSYVNYQGVSCRNKAFKQLTTDAYRKARQISKNSFMHQMCQQHLHSITKEIDYYNKYRGKA